MERVGVDPGTEIGGYRVLGPLGRGGSGSVYRAVDGGGAVVALKVLHPHLAADPDARERLRREVAHLQRLRVPAVARVLDAEIESHEAFVVTELVAGEDLGTRVRRDGPLGADELALLAAQLRDALADVHGAGVLHRDLTPGNVVLTDDGPVLIDFGIAQAADETRVTATGLVMGTPGYLAPEMLEGGEPSEAADWWGWAALLAFAATGRPPFGTRPLAAVLERVRSGTADLQGLDRRTAAALRSALVVDPWRRAEPEAVVAELERAADEPLAATAVVGAGAGATRVLPAAPGRGPRPREDDDEDDDVAATAAWPVTDPAAPDDADASSAWDPDGVDEDAGSWADDGTGTWPDDDPYDDDAAATDDDAAATDDLPSLDGPPRRAFSVLAVGAPLAVLGASRPGVAVVVAVVAAVLVRSVGLDVEAVRRRRARRGPGRADVALGAAGWPWYLLRAALGVLPAVLVGAAVVAVVGGTAWWAVSTGRLVVAAPAPGQEAGELAGNAPWVMPVLVGSVVALALALLWFGPLSRATRTGARWTLRAVAPGVVGSVVLVAVGLVVTVLLLASVLSDPPATVWWPFPGPPELR